MRFDWTVARTGITVLAVIFLSSGRAQQKSVSQQTAKSLRGDWPPGDTSHHLPQWGWPQKWVQLHPCLFRPPPPCGRLGSDMSMPA